MQILTQARTRTERPFRSSDLLTSKDPGAEGKSVYMLTRRATVDDSFDYVAFNTQTGNSSWSSSAHRFTSDRWKLFEGELVLSN